MTVDCRDPERQARFWAAALGYVIEPPPAGFPSWGAYWRSKGVPAEETTDAPDSIMDPTGAGPGIWFQVVGEPKTVKNRWHLDLSVSGGPTVPYAVRRERVEAEASRLVLLGARRIGPVQDEGVDHYAVAMLDPEGNEFDIN